MHRVLKGSGSTAMDHAHCLEMGQIGVVRYFSMAGTASSTVIPMRLTSADTVEDLDILIWLLPLPFASGGFSAIAYGTSVSQCGAYVLFIKKLQVPDIHQGTENAHLDI